MFAKFQARFVGRLITLSAINLGLCCLLQVGTPNMWTWWFAGGVVAAVLIFSFGRYLVKLGKQRTQSNP